MLNIPFDRLYVKKQYRGRPKDKQIKAMGYDTETVGGLCYLLADPTSHIHPKSFDCILDFLTTDKRRGTIGFFFNLRYDFQSILKWLPPEYWQEIHTKGATTYGDFEIVYIPKKMFKIRRIYRNQNKKRTRAFTFFDISQFYKGMTLDAAATKYLGKGKKDPGTDLANMTLADIHKPQVIHYCQYDAQLCQELAESFIATCHSQDLYPTNFCSPASVSTRFFQSKAEIPTINRIPKAFIHMAWLTYTGAFITIFKRGYFDKVYEYDINSAYPWAMTRLPNLDDGRFYMQRGDPPKDAMLGWMKVKVDIGPNFYYPPFVMIRPPYSNYMPCGQFETFITLSEYDIYRDDMIIEPIAGLYWMPKPRPRYPFADTVKYLYHTRKDTTDDNINYFLKICLNGFYGKNLEKILCRDPDSRFFGQLQTGNFFNPFYASYITAKCRVMVYQALRKAPRKTIIGCFTDSIITTKPIHLLLSDDLGEWQFAQSGELLMVGCGVYTLRGEKRLKTKARGFHTTSKLDLFETFARNPDAKTIPIKVKTNISFPRAMIQKRTADMNLLIDENREININFDVKRMWFHYFSCAQEVLEKRVDSLPVRLYNTA